MEEIKEIEEEESKFDMRDDMNRVGMMFILVNLMEKDITNLERIALSYCLELVDHQFDNKEMWDSD